MFIDVQMIESTYDGNSVTMTPTNINVLHIRKVKATDELGDDYLDIFMDDGEIITIAGTMYDFRMNVFKALDEFGLRNSAPKKK